MFGFRSGPTAQKLLLTFTSVVFLLCIGPFIQGYPVGFDVNPTLFLALANVHTIYGVDFPNRPSGWIHGFPGAARYMTRIEKELSG
jgi:hypothetical protein